MSSEFQNAAVVKVFNRCPRRPFAGDGPGALQLHPNYSDANSIQPSYPGETGYIGAINLSGIFGALLLPKLRNWSSEPKLIRTCFIVGLLALFASIAPLWIFLAGFWRFCLEYW